MRRLGLLFAPALMLAAPFVASAHEVYVLGPGPVEHGLTKPPFDLFAVAIQNAGQVAFWAVVGITLVGIVFLISIWRPLERLTDPYLLRLKSFAPMVARVTVGLGFIAGAYYHAIFGPELPLVQSFGAYAPLISLALIIVGTLIVIGFWARAAALVVLALFAVTSYEYGWYMLTYANYLGTMIVLLLLGSHRVSVHSFTGWHERFHPAYHRAIDKIRHLAFPILRVFFGISLLFSSLYAKVVYNNLALQVASTPLAGHPYSLAHYFGMDPKFLVLGAAVVEITLGLFFVFGIEIRFASLFLLFWLFVSLWWFGESVWPHIILIGIPIAFLLHGYDKYSLEGRYFKKGMREPVL